LQTCSSRQHPTDQSGYFAEETVFLNHASAEQTGLLRKVAEQKSDCHGHSPKPAELARRQDQNLTKPALHGFRCGHIRQPFKNHDQPYKGDKKFHIGRFTKKQSTAQETTKVLTRSDEKKYRASSYETLTPYDKNYLSTLLLTTWSFKPDTDIHDSIFLKIQRSRRRY
jgi:hypothetical protein